MPAGAAAAAEALDLVGTVINESAVLWAAAVSSETLDLLQLAIANNDTNTNDMNPSCFIFVNCVLDEDNFSAAKVLFYCTTMTHYCL